MGGDRRVASPAWLGPASCHVAASSGTIDASTVTPAMRHRCRMGKRKAADEAAIGELQDALQVLVDAASRRADPDADPLDAPTRDA